MQHQLTCMLPSSPPSLPLSRLTHTPTPIPTPTHAHTHAHTHTHTSGICSRSFPLLPSLPLVPHTHSSHLHVRDLQQVTDEHACPHADHVRVRQPGRQHLCQAVRNPGVCCSLLGLDVCTQDEEGAAGGWGRESQWVNGRRRVNEWMGEQTDFYFPTSLSLTHLSA